jgi:hypothetical protein
MLEIISLDFDVAGQLLIIHIFICRILEQKYEYNEQAVLQLFIDCRKFYVSVRGEVLCNILIESGIPMKLVRLIIAYPNETHSTFWVGRLLPDTSFFKNGLQQGDASPPLVFTMTLEYYIRSTQANQEGLKLNGIHWLLVYGDDVNILVRSIHTAQNNTEALVVAVKEIGLEVNADRTKYMVMS